MLDIIRDIFNVLDSIEMSKVYHIESLIRETPPSIVFIYFDDNDNKIKFKIELGTSIIVTIQDNCTRKESFNYFNFDIELFKKTIIKYLEEM